MPEQAPYNLFVPRSACPGCGRAIRAVENVPVLSWLALRGKCAGCGMRISPRYPLVELLAGAGAAWSAWHFGFGAAAFGAMLFVWCTIALALIDHETGYLPDDITLPLLWAGLLFNLSGTFVPLQEAVIGAAAGYLTLWSINAAFRLIRGMDGMGYGDFKMTAAAGAFVGWKYLFLVILLSSVVGLVVRPAADDRRAARLGRGVQVPFRPLHRDRGGRRAAVGAGDPGGRSRAAPVLMRLVVGLTGGIGSGKSAAADAFGKLGATVVDTDAIAHELTGPGGAAMAEVRRLFGDALVDAAGAMDRKRMRELVFADRGKKAAPRGAAAPDDPR